MSKRIQRPQKSSVISDLDTRQVVVPPLDVSDRKRNPKDLDPEVLAQHDHVEHGGSVASHVEVLAPRGTSGRKRPRA